MPAPLPSDFKNVIPSATSSLCDKVAKLLRTFITLVYNWIAFEFTEAGTPTDEYKAMICELGCTGSGSNPENPNMPSPTGISASDGAYSDKVRVIWNAVTAPGGVDPVSQYKVYRSLSTNDDPANAALVGTVSAPTTSFDDTTVVQGTTYNYWVQATNGTDNSNFGGPDVGNSAASAVGGIDAITDLMASQGFSPEAVSYIFLQWTPPTGATKYDIYRHTVNDFSLATKIGSDVVPKTTINTFSQFTQEAYDNVENIVYMDEPPDSDVQYFYWVKAKADAPPAESEESNAAQGWARIGADEVGTRLTTSYITSPYTVPAGVAKVKMVVYGAGGGGAGGGEVYGGGGGGGAAIATLEVAVSPGDTIETVLTPADNVADGGAALNHGDDGAQIELQLNSVTILTMAPGLGGEYSASGAGAGGTKGSASGSATHTVWNGLDGKPGSGTNGGRSGPVFGKRRKAGAWYQGIFTPPGYSADHGFGEGGGGSFAQVGVGGAPDAIGGDSYLLQNGSDRCIVYSSHSS